MRPILPSIRQTPYGRRIQSKVQEREGRLAAFTGRAASGHASPHSGNSTQSSDQIPSYISQGASVYQPNVSSGYQSPMYTAAANYGPNIASPQPHRLSNPPLPHHLHNSVQNQAYQYGPGQNGMGNFF
jgi:hypothetical protein